MMYLQYNCKKCPIFGNGGNPTHKRVEHKMWDIFHAIHVMPCIFILKSVYIFCKLSWSLEQVKAMRSFTKIPNKHTHHVGYVAPRQQTSS